MAVQLDEQVRRSVGKALGVLARHARIAGGFVFGSRVEGLPDEYSDIDLAVFVVGAEDWDMARRARTAALVQEEAGDHVELHFFPAGALEESEPASFATYIKKHGVRVPIEAGK